MVKLNTYAENRIRRIGFSASGHDAHQLLTEAMNSLLETGRRHWYPDKVDLPGFLIGAMWSISSNWARKGAKGQLEIPDADLTRNSEIGEGSRSATVFAFALDPSPEEQLLASELQTEEQLVEEIESLFKDQLLAPLILDGWKAGMKGPEIIEALNIDETEYRTAVRLIRRRTGAKWPKGKPYVR